MTAQAKTKEAANGTLTTAEINEAKPMQQSLEAEFDEWMKAHNAGAMVLLLSPGGGRVPIQDGLAEHCKGWQVAVIPVKQNG